MKKAKVYYKGNLIAIANEGQTITLSCEGKVMEDNLKITAEDAVIISFTIDGETFEAEDGMTWEEWLESEYNTANYRSNLLGGVITVQIKSGSVSFTGYGLSYNDAFVPITDTVVANRAYVQKYGKHGGGND